MGCSAFGTASTSGETLRTLRVAPRGRWRSGAWVLCACLGGAGCAAGRALPATGPHVDGVELIGAESIDADRLLEGLATRESPDWPLVVLSGEYEFLDESLLERDLE